MDLNIICAECKNKLEVTVLATNRWGCSNIDIRISPCEKCIYKIKEEIIENTKLKSIEDFKDSKEYKEEIDQMYKRAYDAGYEIGFRAGKEEPTIIIQGEE